MSRVVLDRSRAVMPGGLPRVCMVCGQPATRDVPCTYTARFIHMDRPAPGDAGYQPTPQEKAGLATDPGGCLYLLLYPFVWLASGLTARRFLGVSPRCDDHAEGVYRLDLIEATVDRVVVDGVHPRFAEAVTGRRTFGP